MDSLLRVVIFSLLLTFSISATAEEVSTGGTEETSTDASDVAACTAAENKFKDFVLENIDSSIKAFDTSFKCITGAPVPSRDGNCQELNQSNMDLLKDYRAGLDLAYTEVRNQYIENHQAPDLARKCLEGEFSNFRGPIQPREGEYMDCQPMITGFMTDQLDFKLNDILTGKTPSNLSEEQRKAIKAYQQSPIGRALSTNAKYIRDMNDDQLKRELANSFNDIKSRVSRFREKIAGFSDTDLYKLYDFNNQFERFVSYQEPGFQSTLKQCKANSSFVSNCIRGRQTASRCGAKIWDLASDFIPFVPVIDGFAGLGDVRAARDAGIMTTDESVAASTGNMMKVMFGIGGITSLARGAATRVAAARITAATTRARGPLSLDMRNLSPGERARILATNGSLKPGQRLAEAARVLNRRLSGPQRRAVMEAHEVGAARGARYGTYSRAELREKVRILRAAGFKPNEIDQLMRRGITGQGPYMSGTVRVATREATARAASDTFRGATDDFVAGSMSTSSYADRMVDVASNLARKVMPGAEREAWILSSRADDFLRYDVKSAGTAQQIVDYIGRSLRNMRSPSRPDRFVHETLRLPKDRRWQQLYEYQHGQYMNAIRILRERFPSITIPDY